MEQKKNVGAIVAIVAEVILIILFVAAYKDVQAECDDFECLGKVFSYFIMYVSGVGAVMNLFVIQYARKKSFIFPLLVVLCIITIYAYKLFQYYKYNKEVRFEPNESLEEIINNDYPENDDKYISYFIHNDMLYYYKYDETHGGLEGEKGALFKTDLKGENAERVCILKAGMSFYYDFIYGDEVFYTTREKDENGSYHNSLKRLNINSCEEKTIMQYNGDSNGEWKYLYGSRNNDEIMFYDDGPYYDEYALYRYNLKEDKIINSKIIHNINSLIDYDNMDEYYVLGNSVYINDKVIYEFDQNSYSVIDILSFDKENIYLYSNNSIYVLNKTSKQITGKRDIPLKDIKNLRSINMFMKNYVYIDGMIYQYVVESNSFQKLFEGMKTGELEQFYYSGEQRIVNGYYLFGDRDYTKGDKEYGDNIKTILSIYDKEGNMIIEETTNGNLSKYRIDNNRIYLIYKDNSIKKIDMVTSLKGNE